jgi:hypothetical protein
LLIKGLLPFKELPPPLKIPYPPNIAPSSHTSNCGVKLLCIRIFLMHDA